MRARISEAVIDRMAPGTVIWDTSVIGFGVRRQRSAARSYILKVRVAGRQRLLTIGQHGSPWTPHSARNEAKRLLGEIASGKTPASRRNGSRAGATLAELVESYLEGHVSAHCKATTLQTYRAALKLLPPAIGRRPAITVSRGDLARAHLALKSRAHGANMLIRLCSAAWSWGVDHGLLPEGAVNPCRRLRPFKELRRERLLSPEEIAALVAALDAAAARESLFVIAAFRVLILTGARHNEIRRLTWHEVDLAKGVLKLADSKTGPKAVYLPPAAIELLAGLPRINHMVFPGTAGRPVALGKPWHRVRTAAGMDDLRIHDLRHVFASVAAAAGVPLVVVAKLLGHRTEAMTARYSHAADRELSTAAATIAAALSRAPQQN